MNAIISEAMATGLPVITTDHSGLPEQVVDGNNGFVVPEGDVLLLAEKILFLIEREDLWCELGRLGRKHVRQNYDSGRLIERQLSFYQDLLRVTANRCE